MEADACRVGLTECAVLLKYIATPTEIKAGGQKFRSVAVDLVRSERRDETLEAQPFEHFHASRVRGAVLGHDLRGGTDAVPKTFAGVREPHCVAAAMWITPWGPRRGVAAAAMWIFRGDRVVAATPRLPHG